MSYQEFYQKLGLWVSANIRAWPEIIEKKDWLRSVRKAQGIKRIELAEKLGVSPARVSMMERDEDKGTLTLKSLERAAQALDCELVYLFIPKKSLQRPLDLSDKKPRMKILPGSSED